MDLITLDLSCSKAESKSGPVGYPVQCFQNLPKLRKVGIQYNTFKCQNDWPLDKSFEIDLLKSSAWKDVHCLRPFVLPFYLLILPTSYYATNREVVAKQFIYLLRSGFLK